MFYAAVYGSNCVYISLICHLACRCIRAMPLESFEGRWLHAHQAHKRLLTLVTCKAATVRSH